MTRNRRQREVDFMTFIWAVLALVLFAYAMAAGIVTIWERAPANQYEYHVMPGLELEERLR